MRELAEAFSVNRATIYGWAHDHPEFSDAVKAGRDANDDRVELALYERAVGYTYDSEEIHVLEREEVIIRNGRPHKVRRQEIVRVPIVKREPPSVPAAIFWLKNRRQKDWRDRRDYTGVNEAPLSFTIKLDNPNNFQGDPLLVEAEKNDGNSDAEPANDPDDATDFGRVP